MELNPEDVKAELAAVQIACDEVSARLDRSRVKPEGHRPSILSRVSKAGTSAPGSRQQHPVKSYSEYDRRSSRRFVNRDWNIARKRTAEGLFVDDQEDAEVMEVEEDQGPPRKRIHAQDPALQTSENKSNRLEPGIRLQPARQNHKEPYNPYTDAQKLVGGQSRSARTGAVLHRRHMDDGVTRRGFDTSRISFAPNAQQRENSQPSSTQQPTREHDIRAKQMRRIAPHHRRAALHHQGEDMQPCLEERINGDGTSGHMEEGEVETLPSGPPPAGEEFVVERRPERQVPVPDKVQQRNRRMFGALLGHLDGAERQEKKFEQSTVLKRRKELEQHAAERARLISIQARQAERSRLFEARRKDIATKRELLLQQNMKKAKLLCAERIAYAKGLLRFIRTETIPPILWEPAGVNSDVEHLFEQQATDFESWAEEQLDKLRLDQQGMRERAEKQWATIDRIREERHKANLGRWKSATEAAQAVPKAVRSSVMTAKDYRERAQRMHQAEAAGKDELEQAGNEDDQDHAAADDAEAHDDTYLIADADKAAADGCTTAVAAEDPPGCGNSAGLERHDATDKAIAPDEQGAVRNVQDHIDTHCHGSGEHGDSANENVMSNKNGVALNQEPEDDNSEDSLSLSE